MSLLSTKQELYENWKKYNIITDDKLLSAFLEVPREEFIGEHQLSSTYGDFPLPIGFGQTISQPTTVMIMLQLLDLRENHTVLEVGGGSAYNAAIMSKLCSHVYTIERISGLAEFGRENIRKCRIKNVSVICGDGKNGYPEKALFDRIIVTAAGSTIPKALVTQLKEDGIMILPLGPRFSCDMVKIQNRKNGKFSTTKHGKFSFVPLV